MSPATWPRARPELERLLVVDAGARTWVDETIADLPSFVRRGDLVVVNDAATLPASLRGATATGEAFEARLTGVARAGAREAVLFGAGDWHTRTEDRGPAPAVRRGDVLELAEGLRAEVLAIEGERERPLVTLRFDREGAALWSALYRAGKPVQYAYVAGELSLWHVQTAYASRPWAVEMPSAGRPLSWSTLFAVVARGARLASVTHAAGLSSTGVTALDAAFPRPERWAIPLETVAAVRGARTAGGRVIAVGTSVVRALEGSAAAHGGELAAGEGITSLLVGPGFVPRVVDGLLTGMHEPTATHYAMLQAFAPLDLLRAAYADAERRGYLGHEFGDSTLVLPSSRES